MQGILFDTSVYIDASKRKDPTVLLARNYTRPDEKETRPLWLSVVVLEELLVGATNPKAQKLLLKLEHDFTNVNRLLVPKRTDWIAAGRILSEIGKKYGFEEVGRARMINDALIAISAASMGIRVFTTNGKDFARLAEFCPLNWEEI